MANGDVEEMNGSDSDSELNEDVKAMLRERIGAADANPHDFYTSEEVEAYLRRDRSSK